MNKVDLTIGIPVYNGEKYIIDLLKCFSKSDKFNYEIIIIDDGSTDRTYEMCKTFCNNKLNVRLYKQKNHGVSYTRNKIIELSLAQWITFIDSDDLINFSEYEKNFYNIIDSNFELVMNVYNRKNYNMLKKSNNILPFLISKEIINSPCTKFYKKNILLSNKIFFDINCDLGEDLLFNLNYFLKISKENIDIFYSNMYIYRKINNESLTQKNRSDKFDKLMLLNEKCQKMFDDIKIRKAFEFIRVKNSLSCIKNNFFVSDENFYDIVERYRKYKKRVYLFLNSFYETLLYIGWYKCPKFILKIFLREVKNNEKN